MQPIKNKARRKFVKNSLLTAVAFSLGPQWVFAEFLPKGMSLPSFDSINPLNTLPGKSPSLNVLNDRPVNAETPAHLLNDPLTPNDLFFVRNNGLPPVSPDINTWTLTIEGASAKRSVSFTLQELKTLFKVRTLNLTLECGGNGRKEFNPPAKGNQWGTGAVGCAAWTGVRLKDVLEHVGVKNDAVYIAYYGADLHLSGDPKKDAISRGVPIQKAMEEESLIAWSMNGQDLPLLNGYPLRLVFGGFPASCSGKWLEKILIRNKVHDGQKMKGQAYRVPCKPVAPGTKVKDEDMCIIEEMPVKSLITYPKTGATIELDKRLPISGQAWTAADQIVKVECSIDFGQTWQECSLGSAANKYAWQKFNAKIKFPETGYYELWSRATDTTEATQPIILPGWNPKGYLNNACHRIAIKVID